MARFGFLFPLLFVCLAGVADLAGPANAADEAADEATGAAGTNAETAGPAGGTGASRVGEENIFKNPIGIFAGLDKITGQITTFEVPIDEVRRFGALNVRPRVCNSRPVTVEPKTTAFVEVDENLLTGGTKRIFSGWMLAESPGLNAVEHPVYDVWLTGCRDPNRARQQELEEGVGRDNDIVPPLDDD